MTCPICKEYKLVPIWYGYPDETKIEMAKQNILVLGGYPPKEYTHYCYKCNETYPFIEEF